MTGPLSEDDVRPEAVTVADVPTVEVTESREAEVGGHRVRRALPRRGRRTVGAWCFADHLGPFTPDSDAGWGVGPHPHIGLQTVTWLVAGAMLHRDSLGSEQTIRPGQLNLMTAGSGISHAEEPVRGYRGEVHGIQLWVAQPEATRNGDAAFEHHGDLPQVELGDGVATVLVGDLAGATSSARRDSDHIGAELQLRRGATTVLPLRADYEHALVVLDGVVVVGGEAVTPGHLAYLGADRDELAVTAGDAARVLLLGGVPFEAPILMWWNFVARSRSEIDAARAAWNDGGDRFGDTGSPLERIVAPGTPW